MLRYLIFFSFFCSIFLIFSILIWNWVLQSYHTTQSPHVLWFIHAHSVLCLVFILFIINVWIFLLYIFQWIESNLRNKQMNNLTNDCLLFCAESWTGSTIFLYLNAKRNIYKREKGEKEKTTRHNLKRQKRNRGEIKTVKKN